MGSSWWVWWPRSSPPCRAARWSDPRRPGGDGAGRSGEALLLLRRLSQLVAEAPDGDDAGGVLGVVLDLAPQEVDVLLGVLAGAVGLAGPDPVEDLLAGEDLPRPGDQEAEQLVLLGGELHLPAGHLHVLPLVVHQDVAAAEDLAVGVA